MSTTAVFGKNISYVYKKTTIQPDKINKSHLQICPPAECYLWESWNTVTKSQTIHRRESEFNCISRNYDISLEIYIRGIYGKWEERVGNLIGDNLLDL